MYSLISRDGMEVEPIPLLAAAAYRGRRTWNAAATQPINKPVDGTIGSFFALDAAQSVLELVSYLHTRTRDTIFFFENVSSKVPCDVGRGFRILIKKN
jgi:hypothetical protein